MTFWKLFIASFLFFLMAGTAQAATPAVANFVIDKKFYPSSINPNFLPEGTLIKSVSRPEVFYVKAGKKSWVIPGILNRWLGENHFYKHDIILTIPDSDLARYPQTTSVNPVYIGKVLQHPDGTQFYIDDKLRKRKLSASVRAALKFPAGNLYPTSIIHLKEFATGPDLTSARQPGGMVVYSGPFHGGRIWKMEENSEGKIMKRLFLSDYLYEAWYYPDENQRVAISDAALATYPRGLNIERYPSGWVVQLGPAISVVQNETLRQIGSPAVYAALGYNPKYNLTVFPEFLQRYPKGYPISAFKGVTASSSTTTSAPAPAPNTALDLIKVRPAIRTLISEVNNIYLSVFDKDVTVSENQFWVNYLYNGEVSTKDALVAAMQRTKSTGAKPALTSRTAVLAEELLESKWFPYLFYFVWQKEPSGEDQAYWFDRIHPGDRDTIEKLGGTLQWLKENYGTTRR